MALSKKSISLEPFFVLVLIPIACGILLILKVFLIPGCFAFDWCDDVKHTFMGLLASREILRAGEIPMINLFHNFGTPILGDALTYPFAIQSITYAFLPSYLAMTLNRFLVAFLTVSILTYYYKRLMSVWSASLCALLVFFSPGFLWHVAHHHYQMPILFCVLSILLEERFTKSRRFLDLFYLYAVLTLMVLSTNIQLAIIAVPFILAYQWFLSGNKFDRLWFLVLAALVAAFIFSYPQSLNFFILISESLRSYLTYGGAPTTKEFLRCLIAPQVLLRLPKANIYPAIYYSFPVLFLILMGLKPLFSKKTAHPLILRSVILGIVPALIVLVLVRFQKLWGLIPFVKSTDITRILWISNIFLMPLAGWTLDAFKNEEYSEQDAAVWFFGTLGIFLFYQFVIGLEEVAFGYKLSIGIFLTAFIVYMSSKKMRNQFLKSSASGLFYLAVISALGFSVIESLGLQFLEKSDCEKGGHHFSWIADASYEPKYFLKFIDPYSRVATHRDSAFGDDFKFSEYKIFGSMGRNPLINKAFTNYLISRAIIGIDESPLISYHFKPPWNAEELSKLGIRYVVQQSALDGLGQRQEWPILASAYNNQLFLRKNPMPASLVYLIRGNKRKPIKPEDIYFKGNGMKIDLSSYPVAQGDSLMATFIARKGWKAWVDANPKNIFTGPEQFIRMDVNPGEKWVSLKYEPYLWYHFLGGILASILLVGISFKMYTIGTLNGRAF